jgi:hypothetical protein
VLRLADAQADVGVLRIRDNAGKQLTQLFERVGVQFLEVWIHDGTNECIANSVSIIAPISAIAGLPARNVNWSKMKRFALEYRRQSRAD